MNIRRARFAEYYRMSGNATDAAKKAGYSERSAYSQGERLLKNAEVLEYIQKLESKEKEERILNSSDRKVLLSDIARDEMNDPTARIKAIDTLNKMTGEYATGKQQDDVEKPTSNLYVVLGEEDGTDYNAICEAETGDEMGAHAAVQE